MNDRSVTGLVAVTDDESMIDVLVSSLYPGARRESAAMVLAYCRAAGLDPLLKPVHIVPMSVKTGNKDSYGNDEYTYRDTVMPGIGLYRIQAARTGEYAGMDEPRLGPMQTLTYQAKETEWVSVPGKEKRQPREKWVEKELVYPEYVVVTVYRMVGGYRCPYPALEYWLENYATANKYSDAPNSMWARRTIGQLIKCAEAQALRKGFPEVGSQPTADEMEGKAGYMTIEAEPSNVYADEPAPAAPAAPAAPQRMSEKAKAADAAPETAAPAARAAADVVAKAPAPAAEPAPPAPAPAPAAPAPAAPAAAPARATGNVATEFGDPATDGERMNIIVTAKTKLPNGMEGMADLLVKAGITGLNPMTLDGLTKTQFRTLKGLMK